MARTKRPRGRERSGIQPYEGEEPQDAEKVREEMQAPSQTDEPTGYLAAPLGKDFIPYERLRAYWKKEHARKREIRQRKPRGRK